MEEQSENKIDLDSLRQQTISGFIWNSIDKGITYFIAFIFGIFIVRILSPDDYGVFGLASIFFAVSNILIDSGISSILIQRKDTDELDYSTVHVFNIAVGFALYIILFLVSPIIGYYFNEPRLILMIRVSALTMVISSFGYVLNTLLVKKMLFRKTAILSFINTFSSGLFVLIFAIMGFHYWALVIGGLITNCIYIFCLMYISEWKPNFRFSFERLQKLFAEGAKLLTISLLATAFGNAYKAIIGKRFNINMVGFYERAIQTEANFTYTTMFIIRTTSLPSLSNFQDNNILLLGALRRIINLSSFFTFAIAGFLFVVSEHIFVLLFTDKWLTSAAYFKILMIPAAIHSIISLHKSLFIIKKKNTNLLKFEIVSLIFLALIMSVTFFHSIDIMLYGNAIYVWTVFLALTVISKKTLEYEYKDQFTDLKGNILIALVSTLVSFVLINYLEFNYISEFIIIFGVYFTSIIVLSLLFKLGSFREIMLLSKPYFLHLKNIILRRK